MSVVVLLSLSAALTCFFFALLVLVKGIKNSQNRSFFLATVFTGIWTAFPFLTSLPESDVVALSITRLLYVFAAFVPTTWFYFMICILGRYKDKNKLYIFYFISLVFAFLSYSPSLIEGVGRFTPYFFPKPGFLYLYFMVFFAIVFSYVLYRVLTALRDIRGYHRGRLIYVCWAYLIGAISGVIHFIAAYTGKEPFSHDILILLVPCILSYAILKYRLMDITLAITRTTIFVVLYTLVWGLPFLLIFRAKDWLVNLFGTDWWFAPMVLMALLGTFGTFVYIYLQKRAESILLREQRRYQETLKHAAAGMTRIHNPKQLFNSIVDILTQSVYIAHSAIYLCDEKTGQFALKEGRNLKKSQPRAIDKKSQLISWLKLHKVPLVYEEIQQKTQENSDQTLKEIESVMRSLDAAVIVPSFLEDKLLDLIILGDKLSGKIYTPEDLNIFSVLASQAALAIENALLYENIEEQVKKRTRELIDVQKQLVHAEKLATIGTLAGGVAHEINNPLTAILTNVQMLLSSGELDKESLEMIEEATKRCKTIVQKLMTYAKKPLEQSEVSKVNLLEAIKSVIAFLEFQFRQDNVKIALEARENNYPVSGNKNEIEQVITNIVLNARDAIKAIKKSGVISISLSKINEWVSIEIKDEGCGIPKEILAKIFDPFFTTKEVGKGVGLGLSICQSIIDKHNGVITVQSQAGKGSVFTVKFPPIGDGSLSSNS